MINRRKFLNSLSILTTGAYTIPCLARDGMLLNRGLKDSRSYFKTLRKTIMKQAI